MKKIIIAALILLLSVSISIILIHTAQSSRPAAAVLCSAFDASGAEVVSSEVYLRGRLADGSYDTEEERKKLLELVIGCFKSTAAAAAPAYESHDTDRNLETTAEFVLDDARVLHASVVCVKTGESWLIASLTSTSGQPEPELEEDAYVLEQALRHVCRKPTVSLSITGSLAGGLNAQEREIVCNRMLESAGGSEVEGIEQEDLVSVSAFAPSIKESVRVGGKKVNLSAALRYNSYEDRTYIWLATPLITAEY